MGKKPDTNDILTMKEGLFRIAAGAGPDSPARFNRRHLIYTDERGKARPVRTYREHGGF